MLGALLVVSLLVSAGVILQGGSKDDARPSECSGSANTAASVACKEALLIQALDEADPAALNGIDGSQRVAIARELCKQATALSAADAIRPLRSQFFDVIATTRKAKPGAVAAVSEHLDKVCPQQAKIVAGLAQTNGPPAVVLEVDGVGPVSITYTNNVGQSSKEDGFASWTLPLNLQEIADLKLEATPRKLQGDGDGAVEASKLRCTIRVGSKVVDQNSAESKGSGVKCYATSEQVVTAANAPA